MSDEQTKWWAKGFLKGLKQGAENPAFALDFLKRDSLVDEIVDQVEEARTQAIEWTIACIYDHNATRGWDSTNSLIDSFLPEDITPKWLRDGVTAKLPQPNIPI